MYTLVASLCCAAETNTTLQSNYTPIKMISWGFLVFSLLYLFPLVASEEKKIRSSTLLRKMTRITGMQKVTDGALAINKLV